MARGSKWVDAALRSSVALGTKVMKVTLHTGVPKPQPRLQITAAEYDEVTSRTWQDVRASLYIDPDYSTLYDEVRWAVDSVLKTLGVGVQR